MRKADTIKRNTQEKRLYIAYGSNLNIRQMFFRCPTAKRVGSGYLEGWRLVFKGSMTGSYLTIMRDPKGKVPVGLFEVREWDEKALDRYEGFPLLYNKIQATVRTEDGDVTGFVYLMPDEAKYGIPTEDYMYICMEGYEDFGFNFKYLRKALRESEGRKNER